MRIPLTLLSHKLRQRKRLPPQAVPTYRRNYHDALNGVIPAEQADSGRWTVDEDHLSLIEETYRRLALGRTTEPLPPAPAKRRTRLAA
jgi:hypothetical protein